MSLRATRGHNWLRQYPIVQGGMGVNISSWLLARTVALLGQFGTVSATALHVVVLRLLQDGDQGGHIRRAFDALKLRLPQHADKVDALYTEFWLPNGRAEGKPYKRVKPPGLKLTPKEELIIIASTFAIVWLAKEGHFGRIGINFLMKIKFPLLQGLFGAMLADVDAVAAGAGDPSILPGLMGNLAAGQAVELEVPVANAKPETRIRTLRFDPAPWLNGGAAPVRKPACIAIVSSHEMAAALKPVVDGFVIENNTAGGHNAPPVGRKLTDPDPVTWSEKDQADLAVVSALGLPFWLGGGFGWPSLAAAQETGATGIQVGSLFALCNESGMEPGLREQTLSFSWAKALMVINRGRFSPTRMPFAVVEVRGNPSGTSPKVRNRVCDIAALATLRQQPDGTVVFICPAEARKSWIRKGGHALLGETSECLCNGLLATAGLPQVRRDGSEPPIQTLGDHAPEQIRALQVWARNKRFSAEDVITYLLGEPSPH